jgi:uncharacterized protein (DUF1015 family)
MSDVRPFRALRPRDDLAGEIIAPPYDVLTEAEARAIALNPRSFVRITRSEVDLPPGTDAHSDLAYRKARENLDLFRREGWMVLDDRETYYLYGQTMGEHRQVCVLAGASVAEYDDGRVAKHEHTRPDKEDDRTHHMDVLDAQVGLVFLGYRPTDRLAALVARGLREPAAWRVTTDDAVLHELRVVPAAMVAEFQAAFAELPRLYVCDGHHRSAAASRIHRQRADAASAHFLVGIFPADELQILAYNRLVRDLNGLTSASFVAAVVDAGWDVQPGAAVPGKRQEFAMYLDGAWHSLTPREHLLSSDPVRGLDVSLLQDHLLGPILGIDDPRRSERIEFAGGIRGTDYLSEAVEGGRAAVAFSLFPTGLDQLFAVADAGEVMPPKSTWFEPKLREGVVVRLLG